MVKSETFVLIRFGYLIRKIQNIDEFANICFKTSNVRCWSIIQFLLLTFDKNIIILEYFSMNFVEICDIYSFYKFLIFFGTNHSNMVLSFFLFIWMFSMLTLHPKNSIFFYGIHICLVLKITQLVINKLKKFIHVEYGVFLHQN